ncbi:creatininase family protein [Candidatus Latescibacterota bacterium]
MSGNKTRRYFLESLAVSCLAAGVGSPKSSYAAEDAPIKTSPMSSADGRYINPRKVLLYECTRKEIRERLLAGELKAAIIPTGSTEQHNEHLAMIMDTAGALLVSQQAALKLYPQVIVTTPVPIGISPHWMDRKGTLTLRKEIFIGIVYDICDSLKTHGIRNILIVNGHGGNSGPLNEAAPVFRSKLGISIEACNYFGPIFEDKKRFLENKEPGEHAGEGETSIALAAFPERVRYQGIDPHHWEKVTYAPPIDTDDKTFFEVSKLATAEKGERIIGHSANWVAEKLRTMIERE